MGCLGLREIKRRLGVIAHVQLKINWSSRYPFFEAFPFPKELNLIISSYTDSWVLFLASLRVLPQERRGKRVTKPYERLLSGWLTTYLSNNQNSV